MDNSPSGLPPAQKHLWQNILQDLDQNNILCHCQKCHREWVSSTPEPCICGSVKVEYFSCWQFPDD